MRGCVFTFRSPRRRLLCRAGAIPLSLQLRPEGPAAEPAAGRSDETLRQPEERRQRHQGPQVVRHDRLDRHLREKGECRNSLATVNRTTLLRCRLKCSKPPFSYFLPDHFHICSLPECSCFSRAPRSKQTFTSLRFIGLLIVYNLIMPPPSPRCVEWCLPFLLLRKSEPLS